MSRTIRSRGALIAGCAVIVLLLVTIPRGSSAQTGGEFSLGEVTHRVDGTVEARLGVSADALASLVAFVDGEPVPFEVLRSDSDVASQIVFVIENSVSMDASHLADIRTSLAAFVSTLDPIDEVGIVEFGGGATVALPLTTDRAAFDAALGAMSAGGGSALYSGVTRASEMLADGEGAGLLVLVTYGWDWGELSTDSPSVSYEAVATSGAEVYVQSMLIGASFDAAYLTPLASDGVVHDRPELADLPAFAWQPSPSTGEFSLAATVPPLARGTHELRVMSDQGFEAAADFVVTNVGLLSAQVTGTGDTGGPIAVQVAGPGGLQGLDVTALLSGTLVEVEADGSIVIDPWAVAAGTYALEITATVDGAIADELSHAVTVPALLPILRVDETDGQSIVATLQAQPRTVAALVAIVDDAVVAESADGRLVIGRPTAGIVRFEARSADGTPVVSAQTSAPPIAAIKPGASSFWMSPAMLATLVALTALAMFLGRRRWMRLAGAGVAEARSTRQSDALAGALAPTLSGRVEWTLVVRPLSGEVRRVQVGHEPVSLGSSQLCTVTLTGDLMRFVHLVVARDGDTVNAHQFGPVTVNGQETNVEDGAVLTSAVMEIGDVAVWVESATEGRTSLDAA